MEFMALLIDPLALMWKKFIFLFFLYGVVNVSVETVALKSRLGDFEVVE